VQLFRYNTGMWRTHRQTGTRPQLMPAT